VGHRGEHGAQRVRGAASATNDASTVVGVNGQLEHEPAANGPFVDPHASRLANEAADEGRD